jgi:hypothetical protein
LRSLHLVETEPLRSEQFTVLLTRIGPSQGGRTPAATLELLGDAQLFELAASDQVTDQVTLVDALADDDTRTRLGIV